MPAHLNLHALCCGRLDMARALFFADASAGSRMTIPVSAFLVRHPSGTLLFDTGMACGAAADPVGVFGEHIAALFKTVGAAHENVLDQLAAQGVAPDQVSHVACSHLHFDHCGCNRLFPRARILIQRAELDAARAPGSRYDRRLWDLPLDYQLLDGEHDVFGDASVLLVPTPGHTAGHQSAVIRTAPDRRFVLAADACYTAQHLQHDIVPPAHVDAAQMRTSMASLRRLGDQAGTELLFGHDAAQWARIEGIRGALA